MESLKFDLSKKSGTFKMMNCVNNGPVCRRHTSSQKRSNFTTYKEARIPYARNHDAAFFSTYGGEHTVDITAVFPDFDADPTLPESYDFAVTDEYILVTLDAGTKTFYRLGQKIEHQIKKYGTIPPKNFEKWAVVCEHIIRHYTEGWADGMHLDMPYWEIWNEPDLDEDDCPDKRTWGGTKAQFFDLYEITAKHLKACFPHLKIGGPALAWREEWAEDFICEMHKRGVPIDFFSWHIYTIEPCYMMDRANNIREFLDKYGYENAESICNEWNYVKDWGDGFIDTILTIIGKKGAAFTMACMTCCQQGSVDMLMYYDARPATFNGLFDFYTLRPIKGYYPFLWFGKLYDMEAEVLCENKIPGIYTLCGVDKDGKTTSIITYYTDTENAADSSFKVDFGRDGEYEIYLVDEEHNGELVKTTSELTFTMKPNTFMMIKEK